LTAKRLNTAYPLSLALCQGFFRLPRLATRRYVYGERRGPWYGAGSPRRRFGWRSARPQAAAPLFQGM